MLAFLTWWTEISKKEKKNYKDEERIHVPIKGIIKQEEIIMNTSKHIMQQVWV